MFSRIEAQHFRSFRSVDQSLEPFQALVGPNAAGKTTFLEIIELAGLLMSNRGDVYETVSARSPNFSQLLWLGKGNSFRIALEAPIPDAVMQKVTPAKADFSVVRYELSIAFDEVTNELGIVHETLFMRKSYTSDPPQQDLFPSIDPSTDNYSASLFLNSSDARVIVKKVPGGNDNYYPEGAKTYTPSFPTGSRKSALANVPAAVDSFPVSTWFRKLLESGIRSIQLNGLAIRQPSAPGQGTGYKSDGSNLPWVVDLLKKDERRYRAWIGHVQSVLDDIDEIEVVDRPDDRHRYLVVKYKNGALVPSWLVSDGTLRLLALTVLAYVDPGGNVYLIEEPENGIHPRAIEAVIQSLSSLYQSQLLLATHSPVALNLLEASQVLCFAKDGQGATDIVSGDRHPRLREWSQGDPDLGVLFASGILS